MPQETMFERQERFVHQEGELNSISKTYPGMAHFAGTGSGEVCGKCHNYTKGACEKWRKTMQAGSPSKRVKPMKFPASAISCKYFEARK